ncbi:2-amino-4-hydroxy-6-hydroxymethyldihydropteridine diphosphokinase [Falsiroseomonas sp. E2-1-a20]|uniref:2-amino-4-hydroxy-6- hydroxymethyldihydropteridine diphosphokinase n=1 Tax=Falsiroseomonas sp. E2-1-a20 TaxID=3239300 RepID=UPI003F365AFE
MILVALGANLPGPDGRDALATCRAAAAALDALPGLRLRALSRWYATAPVPADPASPDYVNGVARLEGQAPDPATLLAALQAVEGRFGRVRPYPNAPRTLDLDLIDLDGLVRDAPDPVLPHPRAHMRAFVLAPLADVAPGWVHPGLKRTVGGLLAAVGLEGFRVLAESGLDGYMEGSS